jgi:DegV family protein with EDD domain
MIPVTKMLQTADTLKYLYLGGRIGKAKHLVGSLLKIKPIISMENGEIVALGQARSLSKAYTLMVDLISQKMGANDKISIAYMHAAAAREINQLKQLVEEKIPIHESFITELPPALGVHTGPGTTGLCYFPVSVLESAQADI